MADNNKVTIDVTWFDELRSTANGERYKTLEAAYNQVRKERDELKAKLDGAIAHYCTNATDKLGDACKVAALCRENDDKLAAAERCIEEIYSRIDCEEADNAIGKIIRAYREKKEDK